MLRMLVLPLGAFPSKHCSSQPGLYAAWLPIQHGWDISTILLFRAKLLVTYTVASIFLSFFPLDILYLIN